MTSAEAMWLALAKVAHDEGAVDAARGLIVIGFGLDFLHEIEALAGHRGPTCAWPRTALEVVP